MGKLLKKVFDSVGDRYLQEMLGVEQGQIVLRFGVIMLTLVTIILYTLMALRQQFLDYLVLCG